MAAASRVVRLLRHHRRCVPRHYFAIEAAGRQIAYVRVARWGRAACKRAQPVGIARDQRCSGEPARVDPHQVALHVPTACKCVARYGSEAAWRVAIGVMVAARRRAVAIAVVVIVDVGAMVMSATIAHVPDVDVGVAATAAAVPRVVDFARAKREPAHRAAADADRPATAADKRDQRRRVDRAHAARSRYPAPAAVGVGPAAVVVRRKAPRRIVHPGPAPRRDIRPVTIAIRRPVGRHLGGVPHCAVVAGVLPVAVLIQILIADHVVRHVLGTVRLHIAMIAFARPCIERIAAADIADRHCGETGIDEAVAAAWVDRALRIVFAIHGGAAIERSDLGAAAVVVDVHPECAGPIDDQRHGRRVDFVTLARIEMAHGDVERALGQFDLGQLVIQIEQAEVGLAIHAQGSAAQLQFGAGIAAGGQPVAAGQWTVDAGVAPVLCAGRQETEIAGDIRQPCHLARWVGAVIGGGLRLGQAGGCA